MITHFELHSTGGGRRSFNQWIIRIDLFYVEAKINLYSFSDSKEMSTLPWKIQ